MAISCGCWVLGFSWVEGCESLIASAAGVGRARLDELQHEVMQEPMAPTVHDAADLPASAANRVSSPVYVFIDREHVGRKSAAKAEDLERLVILNHADLAAQSPCTELMEGDCARNSNTPSHRNLVIVRDVLDGKPSCAPATAGSCWPMLRTTSWLLESIRTQEVQQPVVLAEV